MKTERVDGPSSPKRVSLPPRLFLKSFLPDFFIPLAIRRGVFIEQQGFCIRINVNNCLVFQIKLSDSDVKKMNRDSLLSK